jgi:phosphotransferase system enzyme I (PtsI)
MGASQSRERERVLSGRVITPGVAAGVAHVDAPPPSHLNASPVTADRVDQELARFDQAFALTAAHLEEHVREFHAPNDEDLRPILAMHELILQDQQFMGRIRGRIATESMRAERAVEEAFCDAADRLAATRDAYLHARAEDIRDVCQALVRALLLGERAFALRRTSAESLIFVTPYLHVSAVLRARRLGAQAFVTSSQSYTSHGAILLRAAGLPALGGLALEEAGITDGAPVLVDAGRGELVIAPTAERRARAQAGPRTVPADAAAEAQPAEPARTADGVEVRLWANVDAPAQTGYCLRQSLHGLGLLRTEFLVLANGRPPAEEEQYRAYRQVVESLHGRPVIFRTFDLGAEKVVTGLGEDSAVNPALGLRGLRRHLWAQPQELRTQLRALLRATADSEAHLLLPMVTHARDVMLAREHLDEVRRELEAEGIAHNRSARVGAMIEIPAAVLSVTEILAQVDFATVGTNDLTQYLAAADRNNADVARYLNPEAAGLLSAMDWIITRARRLGRAADILAGGEVVSDATFAATLAGMGYTNLVVTPAAAGAVRAAVAEVTVRPPRR